ncbi:uncharacterized protein L969DRAFT_25661 [Mixia osmundae IAM 14324]|uniref:LrgB-like protein n=1 Tax=Mixia osmundae (strain CBS 9802 / IAM 14324 / JCM 22182 / KY 12970) TaxID=764103 RepID=G7E515_MIXOS|nr:uncharacterized protein L969DRAFT_25661 [Mixia osmundae IAM 14324]KEI37786.1 hypothetical protein L969DRAFT_25661 [Mixia osmundae IAM 14324]GAA97925.1 hypothetical protein E5Q_04605 [Mixia osmundae IAM 14324]
MVTRSELMQGFALFWHEQRFHLFQQFVHVPIGVLFLVICAWALEQAIVISFPAPVILAALFFALLLLLDYLSPRRAMVKNNDGKLERPRFAKPLVDYPLYLLAPPCDCLLRNMSLFFTGSFISIPKRDQLPLEQIGLLTAGFLLTLVLAWPFTVLWYRIVSRVPIGCLQDPPRRQRQTGQDGDPEKGLSTQTSDEDDDDDEREQEEIDREFGQLSADAPQGRLHRDIIVFRGELYHAKSVDLPQPAGHVQPPPRLHRAKTERPSMIWSPSWLRNPFALPSDPIDESKQAMPPGSPSDPTLSRSASEPNMRAAANSSTAAGTPDTQGNNSTRRPSQVTLAIPELDKRLSSSQASPSASPTTYLTIGNEVLALKRIESNEQETKLAGLSERRRSDVQSLLNQRAGAQPISNDKIIDAEDADGIQIRRVAQLFGDLVDPLVFASLIVIGLPLYYAANFRGNELPLFIGLNAGSYLLAIRLIPPKMTRIFHPILVSAALTFVSIWALGAIRSEGLQTTLSRYQRRTTVADLFSPTEWRDTPDISRVPGMGDLLVILLEAGIIALMMPLYRYRRDLKKYSVKFIVLILPNCALALFLWPLLARAIGLPLAIAAAFAGKFTSTPLGIEIAAALGADQGIEVVIIVVVGIVVVLLSPLALPLMGVKKHEHLLIGSSTGCLAGAIGASALLSKGSPRQFALASLTFVIYGTVILICVSIPPVADFIGKVAGV